MGLDPGQSDERGAREPEVAQGTGQAPELHVVQKGEHAVEPLLEVLRRPLALASLVGRQPIDHTIRTGIFPGDIIRLGTSGAETPVPLAGGDKPTKDSARTFSSERLAALSSNAVVLREIGFIEAKDLAQAAWVSGSREEKILLVSGDQA